MTKREIVDLLEEMNEDFQYLLTKIGLIKDMIADTEDQPISYLERDKIADLIKSVHDKHAENVAVIDKLKNV